MSERELDGRVALVTGAAAGIGAATARGLARAGARVALVDRDGAVEAAAASIDGETLALVADVAVGADVDAAVAATVERFGRLDILVANAGIQRYGTVDETSPAVWNEVIGTNLTGIYLACHAAVPHLRASGAGAIVVVASVQAFAAQERVAAYAASKGGAIALARSMAVDLAPAIRVNCVCPGSVDTPMLRWAAGLAGGAPEDTVREWAALHPMQRVGTADDVAETIVFLAGPRSAFTTGAVHVVDGGLLARL